MKYLLLILILAVILRFYGLNWDQGYHLHPDERMITMVADRIHLPQNQVEREALFTPQSPLNPQFFAYGSFPVYLLKAAGSLASFSEPAFGRYEAINLVGRALSVFFDLGIIVLLFFLGQKLWGKTAGLLASLFYSVAVLPIQLAHFYAVDTLLTFFTLTTLFFIIKWTEKLNSKFLILTSISFGFALATKTSALLLIIPIIISLIISSFRSFKNAAVSGSLLAVSTLLIFLILEPFALIDHTTFIKQTLEQQQMTKDAFTFPYTLQYVGIIPYWYELKNIFLWGLGPILAILALTGTLFFTYKTFRPVLDSRFLILTTFFWLYFAVVGNFAVAFIRYMLPIYPLFCLFAAIFFVIFTRKIRQFLNMKGFLHYTLYAIPYTLLLIWPLSFLHIYTQPNTRVQASRWILANIPPSAIIAEEHWDDALPLGGNPYTTLDLSLYDPETDYKWLKINSVIDSTDYIIIASNRLYVPLRKLTHCESLPPGRCYKQTAEYYRQLFSGELGFTKEAEFAIYPNIPLLNIPINDFAADESFTVYDHPKIMIFKKNSLTNERTLSI